MSNYKRTYVPGGYYFFTVVTYQRRPIFADSQNVAHLRSALRKIKTNMPFAIDGLVILPDHLHTLWRLPNDDNDFSSRWREIKKATSRMIQPRSDHNNERQVWQRRFYEHLIRDEDDWQKHMDYIHYNPVKHGYVISPGEWPWSSFRHSVEKGWYEAGWGTNISQGVLKMELE